MEHPVEFSFVMPSYKINYIRQAINSVLHQTYSNFELIIVNDASPENVYDVVRTFDDNRISYFENQENIGGKDLIENWNQCLNYAQGEYVILASDDDIYKPTFLKEINDLILKYPECNVIRSRVQRINSVGKVTNMDCLYPEYMSQAEFIYYWAKGMIKCISNYVFKRDYFVNHGNFINFPLAWFSDDATVIKMSGNGIASTKNVLFEFRSSDINISMINNKQSLKIKLISVDLFNRWIYDYLNNNKLLNDNYLNPTYNIHKYLVDMISKIVSNLTYRDILYVIQYLYKNKILYTKEKINVLINYLF
jgi:glycosyltransferase involved in cell wall biosynthesis